MFRSLAALVPCLLAAAGIVFAAPDPYVTKVELTDGAAGARSELVFSFRDVGGEPEKLDEIEVRLAEGMRIHPRSLTPVCPVSDHGPAGGRVCADAHPGSRVGSGSITVDLIGVHTVKAEAYRVEGGPDGADVVFFFPSGQIFGIGAQSIWGTLLDEETPPGIRIEGIQDQLDLPFGATARIAKGRFLFAGTADRPAFRNPTEGVASTWRFETTLVWEGGRQEQRVPSSVARR